MIKRHKTLCAVLTAVLTSAGTGAATHAYDASQAAQRADRATVQAYNDGWLDATCNSGAAWAIKAYGAHCR